MTHTTYYCNAYPSHKPGPAGLQCETREYMEEGFVEAYVQSILRAVGGARGKTFILGGDGRFYSDPVAQRILQVLAGNGAARTIVGQNLLLSTPAASNLVRNYAADGAFILTASRRPGGFQGDFGIKYNGEDGAPIEDKVIARTQQYADTITEYYVEECAPVDLTIECETLIGQMIVEVINPVQDYVALMGKIFDFPTLRAFVKSGFSLRFDAMHAVTGPYAKAIFEGALGAAKGSVRNATPRPDFGNRHPNPNTECCAHLVDLAMSEDAPDLIAASDGDGDRALIFGAGTMVNPSDSLAVIAANATSVPGYADGIKGVGCSHATSPAPKRVAQAHALEFHAPPSGWCHMESLLQMEQITLWGDEYASVGGSQIREKDGIWAVLMWLSFAAAQKRSIKDILLDHWAKYGRDYATRHDYEDVRSQNAHTLMHDLADRLESLKGQSFNGLTVVETDAYNAPLLGHQKMALKGPDMRITFDTGAQAIFRHTGTALTGQTIRINMHRHEPPEGELDLNPQTALKDVIGAVDAICSPAKALNRARPDVIT